MNWSNRLNWAVNNQQATRAPDERDDITLDGIGYEGVVQHSVVNADFTGTVKSLTILPGFTKTLTLDKNLTVLTNTNISGGTITGASDLYVGPSQMGQPLPTFAWIGGDISGTNASDLFIHSSAIGYFSGVSDLDLSQRKIWISGNMTWTGGKINMTNNALITTTSGGTFNVFSSGALTAEGTGSIEVSTGSSMNVAQPSGELLISVQYINEGALNLTQGTMRIGGGGSRNSGVMNLSTDTLLAFQAGGDYHFNSTMGGMTSFITGTGNARFQQGSRIHLTGTVNLANVIDFSDIVDGTGNLNINGTYTWGGKKWTGGSVTVGHQRTLHIGSAQLAQMAGQTLERSVTNHGTIQWDTNNINVANGGAFIIKNTALFDIKGDNTMEKGTGAGTFKNELGGTLRKSGGMMTSEIKIKYDDASKGNVQQKSGTLKTTEKVSLNDGSLSIDAGITFLAAGGFDQESGSTTVNGTLSVTGALNQIGGTITQNFGGTITASGTFTISSGASLIGAGMINANIVNAGILEVGGDNAIGMLNIMGSFTNSSTGDVRMEIANTMSYDRIMVMGAVSLDGDLYVDLIFGAAPTTSDPNYTLMMWMSWDNSQFDNHYLPTFSGGTFDEVYNFPFNTFSLDVI